ncbi:MAG: hypothetical protein CVU44_04340 [Chloroflexi bacterium HGW-Chloroflexi-6]|nr:MAG: hypothetical protein CVU44_04340 [Chloroflexi bacterium HGW-Chloroflexi-6]
MDVTLKQKKIIVLDDNPDWRLTFTGLLTEENYYAVGVAGANEARNRLSAEKFDLALLDLRLDESDETNVDGLDLAEEIQSRWPLIKVIIVTGYSTHEILKRAMEPRPGHSRIAANFVPKSDVNELIEIIRKELG